MTLDDQAQFSEWWDEELQVIVMVASNGYTVVRCDCDLLSLRDMSHGQFTREKNRAAKVMLDDLHWETPLAHAHRSTDGS